jgi:3-phenylpropionate/trans-cinnamate dioxygenase ferredoxin reductase subunit
MERRIVIVGGGQAGAELAAALRAGGHAGPLALVCGEAAPPYQRPPLSKKYLLGELDAERLWLRPPAFYAEQRIDLVLGTPAVALDRAGRTVRLADGRALPWDLLALTTGARPRRLPSDIGGNLAGVHVVRTLADVDALAAEVAPGRRLLVVGGGYVGLEAAAVAAARGLSVDLVEAAPRILARVAAPATSDFFRDLHATHGVRVREGAAIARLTGRDGRLTGADLTDGTALSADLAVVGVGVTPDVALAAEAGLAVADGIATDAFCATSDPAIFAAGDCASFPWRGRRIRLESVQNAIDQAKAAAAAMLGRPVAYEPAPWFWSDQYDVKLQIAGLNLGWERTHVRPGARPGARSVWYYGGGRLLAVDAMNDPRAYMTAKRWLEAGVSPDEARVADPATDLKDLA